MELKPLSDLEILALVQAEYDSAEQYTDEIEEDRSEAIDYYYGRPLGDEVEGRSRVVSSDVADVVEWMMPGLLRTVAGDDTLVAFDGADEEGAKIATLLVQHVVDNQNDGFRLKHDTLKDGLLSKIGAVKWRYVTKREPIDRDYQNLDEMELALLMQGLQRPGAEVQIIGQEAIQQPDGTARYNVRVRVVRSWGQVDIESIPPEELFIPRNARVIDDSCRYVAHDVQTMTRSDLVAMGVPVEIAIDLPKIEDEWDSMRVSRSGADYGQAPSENKMAEYVEYVEHYVLADIDGDGITERRMICTSGDKILRNEVLSCLPIAVWTPFRMPHTVVGRSLADRVMDIQRVRTAILRGTLDNIYTINAGGRYVAQVGQVNMDDLLTMRPGGVVRAKDINAVRPLPVEFIGDKTGMVDERIMRMREERTGVNRHTQGINAESLHQTATGAMAVIEQGEELKELIARLYCEFLIKPLYRGVFDLLVRYQDEPMQLMVAGRPMTIDPTKADQRYGLKVKVGAGNMKKGQKIAALTSLIQSQAEALQMGMPFVTVEQLYNATSDLTELSGLRPERYWVDPRTVPPQPKQDKPDPLVQAEMVKAQSRQQEAAARLQLQEAEAMANMQIEREKMAQEAILKSTEMELRYNRNVPGAKV